ncbi:Uncharacterised protein [Bacteroides heparinolyticus]|uniref:Uncharacterized protein n=1 Tax=Prevotella heparinolytica TaxID=28113 RepID=A0A449I220_9BACE|nr:Uncharacterised protein [Bacteroides heparinolyticus]
MPAYNFLPAMRKKGLPPPPHLCKDYSSNNNPKESFC